MNRRKEPEKHPNHERWLITYSDLITLLMVFFIVMYSMSSVNAQKYESLAASLKNGFNTGKGQNMLAEFHGKNILNSMQLQVKENVDLQQAEQKIKEYAVKNNLDKSIRLTINERGLIISIVDRVLFNSGQAELTPPARIVLDKIINIINSLPNQILVEGHTDNVPIRNNRYPSNWELSTSRATRVIAYFISKQVMPKRLSAAGYAEYKPLVPNDTKENRAINRRVDIVVLRSVANKQETNGIVNPENRLVERKKIN